MSKKSKQKSPLIKIILALVAVAGSYLGSRFEPVADFLAKLGIDVGGVTQQEERQSSNDFPSGNSGGSGNSGSQDSNGSGGSSSKSKDRPTFESGTDKYAEGAQRIKDAFRADRSGFMVETKGKVVALLADDLEGSKHQKMIVEIAGGHTIQLVHNIDLAPRVPARKGDPIAFKGQYEWNERGGVIHWTHHDPRGRHEEGWIKHGTETYE